MSDSKAMASIFDKMRLHPAQLRTVADRRYEDADYLRKSGRNKHTNGAMYMGGFVLECLLKAKLVEKHGWLQSPPGDLSTKSRKERDLFSLCYRSHDLAAILEHLPEVADRLRKVDGTPGLRLLQSLKKLCGEWTIYARYSPKTDDD